MLRPSPVAVKVKGYCPAATPILGPRVMVVAPALELMLMGLELHWTLTPAGRPVAATVTFPEKEPPVVNDKTSVALVPCTIESEVCAAEKVNVGATNATASGTFCDCV